MADLVELVSTARAELSTATAFAKLDEYVVNRDIGEAREHGDRARPIVDHVQDCNIAMSLAAATFLSIATVVNIPPIGLWSVVLAVAIPPSDIRRGDASQVDTAASGRP